VLPVVRGRRGVADAQLAGGTVSGTLAVAWREAGRRVYVANRRAGAPFGPPRLLGRGRIRSVAVGQSANGSTIVAWEDGGRLRARVRLVLRGPYGPRLKLRSRPAHVEQLLAELDPGRNSVVAWTSRDGYVQVAIKPRRERRFDDALELQHTPPDGVALNGVLMAWGGSDGVHVIRLGNRQVAAGYAAGVGGSHVDALDSAGRVAYTRAGHVWVATGPYGETLVGHGHDARFDGGDVVWLDGGVVYRASPVPYALP
jgi:hypothetical protein